MTTPSPFKGASNIIPQINNMQFDVILATTDKGGIGRDGILPWRFSEYLRRFKSITCHTETLSKRNAVIMGRKTYFSIPEKDRPLKGRINIVLTNNMEEVSGELDGRVITASSFEEALLCAFRRPNIESVFVIGGLSLYTTALNDKRCRKIHLTKIHANTICNVFVPEIPSILSGNSSFGYNLCYKEIINESQEFHLYQRA